MLVKNIGTYAKSKGLNKEEYKQLKENFKNIGIAIYSSLKETKGVYNNFSLGHGDDQTKFFIMQELKKLGIEFNTDYTRYRK